MSAARTGWVYSGEFLRHNADLVHPECPERLSAITAFLDSQGQLRELTTLSFSPASEADLLRVHTRRYLELLVNSEGCHLDPDTYCGPGSPAIARLVTGGVLAATAAVMSGLLKNAFCAVRPPGHHALSDRAMGFCLLNNVAVAAAWVVAQNPEASVLILDWDVHHGNGTQAIFYESPQVLYASTHQYPFYPGTGAAHETGRGIGKGYTINKPLAAGAGDAEFLDAITAILGEATSLITPSIVFISAGFDAHRNDPLAMLDVTEAGFSEATRQVGRFAREHCGGRIVSVLEGGYDLESLAGSVSSHVGVLLEMATQD